MSFWYVNSNRVISLFSKSQHIFSHLLYFLLLYSLFISPHFSFPTLSLLYLTHLTHFFLIFVLKINTSTTMEHMDFFFEVLGHGDANGARLSLFADFTQSHRIIIPLFYFSFHYKWVNIPLLYFTHISFRLILYKCSYFTNFISLIFFLTFFKIYDKKKLRFRME